MLFGEQPSRRRYYGCPTCGTNWHGPKDACMICTPEQFTPQHVAEIEALNPDLFAEVRFRLAQQDLPLD